MHLVDDRFAPVESLNKMILMMLDFDNFSCISKRLLMVAS